MRSEDLTGRQFGRLTVTGKSDRKGYGTFWHCSCACGGTTEVTTRLLRIGRTKSCGCLKTEQIATLNRTHGMKGTRTYKSWLDLRQRCNDCNDPDYGGRGISYDPEWVSFEAFLRDMGEAPEGMTIERRDVNGNYTRDNCRWATLQEQANNKRNNLLLTLNGETLTAAQWAARVAIPYKTILTRKGRLGWSDERTLTTPSNLTRRAV